MVNASAVAAASCLENPAVLNFGSDDKPGQAYCRNVRTQEADNCCMLPQLWPAIAQAAREGTFPLRPGDVLVTSNVLMARQLGTLRLVTPPGMCTVITCTMPSGTWSATDTRPGSTAWQATVKVRFRSILNYAKVNGIADLVLGAIGCGSIDNPPKWCELR